MTTAWDLLADGQVFNAILSPFTSTMGGILFFGMIYVAGIGFIYMKSRSPGLVSIAILITSTTMLPSVPDGLEIYVLMLIVLSLTATLYSLYHGR